MPTESKPQRWLTAPADFLSMHTATSSNRNKHLCHMQLLLPLPLQMLAVLSCISYLALPEPSTSCPCAALRRCRWCPHFGASSSSTSTTALQRRRALLKSPFDLDILMPPLTRLLTRDRPGLPWKHVWLGSWEPLGFKVTCIHHLPNHSERYELVCVPAGTSCWRRCCCCSSQPWACLWARPGSATTRRASGSPPFCGKPVTRPPCS